MNERLNNEVVKTIEWCGKKLTIKTNKIAKHCAGSVVVEYGKTIILGTVSYNKGENKLDFFPLTVNYTEKAFATGKIPGGFIKRETKPSNYEVLVSRLIDRPIRPIFDSNYNQDTMINCVVYSYDNNYDNEIAAIIAASAALAISDIPCSNIIGACRVGYKDGNLIFNDKNANSDLDLVIGATKTSVLMVESEAKNLDEETILKAIEEGHKQILPIIELIENFAKEYGKEKSVYEAPKEYSFDTNSISIEKIKELCLVADKKERNTGLNNYKEEVLNNLFEDSNDENYGPASKAFDKLIKKSFRDVIFENNKRVDGRELNEIRKIECETGLLPNCHGDALFTRGGTQSLSVVTLGGASDQQIEDTLAGETKERFMLHYNFNNYSVGEVWPMRAPGRREIGHGKLAHKSILNLLPDNEVFPYTIRLVSEITESDGSSSMATVCAGSMALMDAGVPLTSPVAGIAMGLIKEDEKYLVLSDIMADEDHLGDMDFKVAGTTEGITALQMDIKIEGISIDIMKNALSQAREGRLHILNEMKNAISTSKDEVKDHAPAIHKMKINKDKIKDLIGSGGKVIKSICEESNSQIDIGDNGDLVVFSDSKTNLNKAIEIINQIVIDIEVGDIIKGQVVKITDFGAFVNLSAGKDGLLHISEIVDYRLESISEILSEGQKIKVKVIGIDARNKIKLSMKSISQE